MADAVALEADLGARVVECFGGALGPLRRDDLVVSATADERRRAGSGVTVVGVLGDEVAVQRHDPAVCVGPLNERREARDGALADTASCNSFKIPRRYPDG